MTNCVNRLLLRTKHRLSTDRANCFSQALHFLSNLWRAAVDTVSVLDRKSPVKEGKFLCLTISIGSPKLHADFQKCTARSAMLIGKERVSRLFLHIVYKIPEIDEIILVKLKTVFLLICMVRFLIRWWYRLRPSLGTASLQNLYRRENKKFMTAKAQFSLSLFKNLANFHLCKHFIGGVALPRLMKNNLRGITVKQTHSSFEGHTHTGSSVYTKYKKRTSRTWQSSITDSLEKVVSKSALDMHTLTDDCSKGDSCITTSSSLTLMWDVYPSAVDSRGLSFPAEASCSVCRRFFTSYNVPPGTLRLLRLDVNGIMQNIREGKHCQTASKRMRNGQIEVVDRMPLKTV